MKKNIIWISLCAPYDKVGHAGGKTHNYYLKRVCESNLFDVHLISFCQMEEYEKVKNDLESYNIKNTIIPWTHKINLANIKRKMYLFDSKYNLFNKYGGATNEYYWEHIKTNLLKEQQAPDIIILQWTEIVLFAERVKKIFPSSKIVAIEEDVKFLALYRKALLQKNCIRRKVDLLKYRNLNKSEVNALIYVNEIFTYSQKDKDLLLKEGINNVNVISPYFDDYSKCERNLFSDYNILFYGAMSRADNYLSAIWFIENVFNRIDDERLKFLIVGNKPPQKLMEYSNERVIITGYVEDVIPYFQNSLCMVAPLVSGAGIKIKILEALSSGIPVLTNHIGIEGIDAKNEVEYFHCEKSEEYLNIIEKIVEKRIAVDFISQNAKKMIKEQYDLNYGYNCLIEVLKTI